MKRIRVTLEMDVKNNEYMQEDPDIGVTIDAQQILDDNIGDDNPDYRMGNVEVLSEEVVNNDGVEKLFLSNGTPLYFSRFVSGGSKGEAIYFCLLNDRHNFLIKNGKVIKEIKRPGIDTLEEKGISVECYREYTKTARGRN